jgi:hypothetical protein
LAGDDPLQHETQKFSVSNHLFSENMMLKHCLYLTMIFACAFAAPTPKRRGGGVTGQVAAGLEAAGLNREAAIVASSGGGF